MDGLRYVFPSAVPQLRVHSSNLTGQQPEYAPMDILEREFEHSQILPGL